MLTLTNMIVLMVMWLIVGAVALVGFITYTKDENNYLYDVSTRLLITSAIMCTILSFIILLEYQYI